MSILICVPTYEHIAPETFKSIYVQDANEIHGRPLFDFVKGYGCAQARNLCAREALDYGAEYLMFVDSDVIIPNDAVNRLVAADSDIALGVYPRRDTMTGQTEVFLPGDNFLDENNINLSDIYKYQDDPVIQVKGGGMGCTLIKTDLFNKVAYPWFKYVEYDNGKVLSEDNYFCWRAKEEADAKIVCDTSVRCYHRSTCWI